MSPPRIAVVGSVMTDMVVRVERMPELGETLAGTSFELGDGGKGANQAVMASALGADVSMVACVGDDPFGAAAVANFAARGIDASGVRRMPGAVTGVAPIIVEPTGENRIVIVPGANSQMTVDQVGEAFAAAPAPDAVLCQLEIPVGCVERALHEGRRAEALTILNPAPFARVSPETLALADWIVPNEVEFEGLRAAVLSGAPGELVDDVAALAARLGTAIAVTCGPLGAVLCSAALGPAPLAVPAPEGDAVDTTGAGDAFAGAFAFALARGTAPALAAAFACACATSTVGRRGTQSSYPREPELTALKSILERETLGASA